MAPQGRGRALRGRALRWLLPVVVLLLAAGVLAMHGLGTGHGLTTTRNPGHTAGTAGHHHGPAASPHPAGGASTAQAPLVLAAALDHPAPTLPAPAASPEQPVQASGIASTEPCHTECTSHGEAAAMCLAVLAVALALLLARGPAALRQPWTALSTPTLPRRRPLVLHRAPGLHQLCVSRT